MDFIVAIRKTVTSTTTFPYFSIKEDESVEHALSKLNKTRVNRLVVKNGKKIVGGISSYDLIKFFT